MASVGVRELKEHTSEIVRRVRDGGETIDITYPRRGRGDACTQAETGTRGKHCILGAT